MRRATTLILGASGVVHGQGVVLPLPFQDQQNITTHFGADVIGNASPNQPISDPSVYFPLQQKVQKFQVIDGPHAGNVQILNLWPARRPTGKVLMSN